MQFGIFTVGDVTPTPPPGAPCPSTSASRPRLRSPEQGRGGRARRLRHGRAPQPAVRALLPHDDAGLHRGPDRRIVLSTSTTLITTNDPVKIAEDYATLQHLTDGRMDLMMGRGNTGPVYPWFGKDIRDGIPLAIENYALLRRLWTEDVVDWAGKHRSPLQSFTPRPARSTAFRRSSGTVRSAAPRSPSRPPTTATASSTTTSSGRSATPSRWCSSTAAASSTTATAPPTRRSSGSAARSSCARTARTPCASSALLRQRARLRPRPLARGLQPGDAAHRGQPAAGDRAVPAMADDVGDYQRQLFLMDHAGLPLRPCSSSSRSSAVRSCRSCAGSLDAPAAPGSRRADPRGLVSGSRRWRSSPSREGRSADDR